MAAIQWLLEEQEGFTLEDSTSGSGPCSSLILDKTIESSTDWYLQNLTSATRTIYYNNGTQSESVPPVSEIKKGK